MANPKNGNKVYFGFGAALDVNTLNANGDPIYIQGSQINTSEGCTAYANAAGQLLFYSDGRSLFDALGRRKSSTLKGNSSSTQSALAIPSPVDAAKFYLFVIDAGDIGAGFNLTYNILTNVTTSGLTFDDTDAAFVNKNIPLYPLPSQNGVKITCEKMAATTDGEGGYWLVIKQYISGPSGPKPNFIFFHIDGTTGILNTTPALITPSLSYSGDYNIGQSKFSSDNTKFVSANFDPVSPKIELWDFNSSPSSVALTNPISLPANGQVYGVEFSPDSSKLYITYFGPGSTTNAKKIYQFDLSSGIEVIIAASLFWVGTFPSARGGQLQLLSNGRIYCAHTSYIINQAGNAPNFISVIRDPNKQGDDCDFNGKISDPSNFPVYVPLNDQPLAEYTIAPISQTPISGNTLSGNADITNISSGIVTAIAVGMHVVGYGIPLGATVLAKPTATSITISAQATQTTVSLPMLIAYNVGLSEFGLPTYLLSQISPTPAPLAPILPDFNVDDISICVGDSVIFTDASAGDIDTWDWDFGNGASPNTANSVGPHTVTYNSPGLKSVSLTVTDMSSQTGTKTKSNLITVLDIPSKPIITKTNNVLSTPLISGVTYQWKLNGVDILGETSNAYMFTGGGSYTVVETNAGGCFSVSDPIVLTFGCTDTDALNFDTNANIEDGSCTYGPCGTSLKIAKCCLVNSLLDAIKDNDLGKDVLDKEVDLLNIYIYINTLELYNCTEGCLTADQIADLQNRLKEFCGCGCGTINGISIENVELYDNNSQTEIPLTGEDGIPLVTE